MPTTVINTTEKSILFKDSATAFASKSNAKLRKSYWLFALMNKGWLVNLGTFFIKVSLKLHLPVKNLIKATIFEQFCGGESIEECSKTIDELGKDKIGTILDYSVEGKGDESSFDATLAEILRTIEFAATSSNVPFSVFKVTGVAPADVLEKAQAGNVLTDEEKESLAKAKERTFSICKAAYEKDVRVFIDAEESWIQDLIDDWADELMDKYNHEKAIVYNTFQLYRSDMLPRLKEAYYRAKEKKIFIGAKLVRGAYIEKERVRARENNFCDPIHKTKRDTDADYNSSIDFVLDHIERFSICLGTHNEISSAYCISKMEKLGIEKGDQRVWFAQLLGMSDNISYKLASEGYHVAKYVPYGPVDAVMPYLFRRAEENTSIAGQSSREYKLIKAEIKRRRGKA